nr:hypothetical protein [Tanacetum cinerariifolium]
MFSLEKLMVMVANLVVIEVGELSWEAMEDEEVAMMDGVFEGAFGALRNETWFGSGSSSGCHGDNGG